MNQTIRMLHVVTNMNRGGLETMPMNYYRHIDREIIQFDFLVHRNDRAAYDDEIESLGGTIYRLPRLVPWSSGYKRALEVRSKLGLNDELVVGLAQTPHRVCPPAVIKLSITEVFSNGTNTSQTATNAA